MWTTKLGSIESWIGYCDMHPGGASLISHLAGQDATEAWRQAHGQGGSVSGLDVHAALEELRIGRVVPEQSSTQPLSSSQIRIRDCVFGRGSEFYHNLCVDRMLTTMCRHQARADPGTQRPGAILGHRLHFPPRGTESALGADQAIRHARLHRR